MKNIRINLNDTTNCARPLHIERKIQPFFGVIAIEFLLKQKIISSIKMIDLNDDYVAQSFSSNDCYEPIMIREWLLAATTTQGIILDIGASTGLYSLLSASVGKGRHIHAFEPYARAFSRLINNKEINLFSNIMIHPFAVGQGNSISEFLIKNLEGPITTGGRIQEDVTKDDSRIKMAVTVKSLADVLPINEKIGLIKIDVEGYELFVLENIRKELERWKPVVFFEALTMNALKNIALFFIRMGYEIFCLNEKTSQVEPLPKLIDALPDRNFIARVPC